MEDDRNRGNPVYKESISAAPEALWKNCAGLGVNLQMRFELYFMCCLGQVRVTQLISTFVNDD
jgi:hypothetical protein